MNPLCGYCMFASLTSYAQGAICLKNVDLQLRHHCGCHLEVVSNVNVGRTHEAKILQCRNATDPVSTVAVIYFCRVVLVIVSKLQDI